MAKQDRRRKWFGMYVVKPIRTTAAASQERLPAVVPRGSGHGPERSERRGRTEARVRCAAITRTRIPTPSRLQENRDSLERLM